MTHKKRFLATLRKTDHSKDIFGNECAGKEIGPFIVHGKMTGYITTIDRTFLLTDWSIHYI